MKFNFDGKEVTLPVAARRQFHGLADTIASAAKIDQRFAPLAKAMQDGRALIGDAAGKDGE